MYLSNLTYLKKPILETPQDFCKTWANLVDILIFYLYHVIVRSSKIISYLSRPAQQMIAQNLFSKSFFSEFFLNLFCLKNMRAGHKLMTFFENFHFQKNVPYFCRLCL